MHIARAIVVPFYPLANLSTSTFLPLPNTGLFVVLVRKGNQGQLALRERQVCKNVSLLRNSYSFWEVRRNLFDLFCMP
jgi:hypothetical protein